MKTKKPQAEQGIERFPSGLFPDKREEFFLKSRSAKRASYSTPSASSSALSSRLRRVFTPHDQTFTSSRLRISHVLSSLSLFLSFSFSFPLPFFKHSFPCRAAEAVVVKMLSALRRSRVKCQKLGKLRFRVSSHNPFAEIARVKCQKLGVYRDFIFARATLGGARACQ